MLVAVAGLLVAAPQSGATCPPFENGGEKMGELANEAIDESSGLAASRRHDERFWTHNDSGGEARVFLIDHAGESRGVLDVEGVEATDWEDIAVGPCESGGDRSCIYVADVGDNKRGRRSVSITRVPEPALPDEESDGWSTDEATTVEFTYPGGPRNVETLLVQPETAEAYVIEKTPRAKATVYRVPRAWGGDDPVEAEVVGEIEVDQSLVGGLITGGDVAPDGEAFTVRTYVKVFTFCTDDGEPFESAFEAEAVVSHPRFTFQSEALAYGPDGESIWFTSEGKGAAVVRMGIEE
jgi:hypothetical protein